MLNKAPLNICQTKPFHCHILHFSWHDAWIISFIILDLKLYFVMPPPLGARGIMFSGCPSVRPSVRPSEAWNTLFWHVHGSVGPPFYGMSVRPSVHLSVRPSREVSGHLPENAWREWPEILHADVSWPSSELISLWPRSVDFSNFGAILT